MMGSERNAHLNVHLILLIAYSVGIVALRTCGRRDSCDEAAISSSPDARSAPGFILASMLASNIGAGSTVGVRRPRVS